MGRGDFKIERERVARGDLEYSGEGNVQRGMGRLWNIVGWDVCRGGATLEYSEEGQRGLGRSRI